MKKDSDRSHYHLTLPRSVLFFEQWVDVEMEFDDIQVPVDQQPLNGDDEDLLVPQSQYPGFNNRNKQKERQADWTDLGLEELSLRGPGEFDKTVVSGPMFTRSVAEPVGDSSTSSKGEWGQTKPNHKGMSRKFDRGRVPR